MSTLKLPSRPHPVEWLAHETAVVVVDMQNGFLKPGGYFDKVGYDLAHAPATIAAVKRGVDAARAAGMLTVFIQSGFQIAVGGGDDADIHRDGFAPPQAFDAFFLQQPQYFGLQAKGHIADFIQKNRSAVGLFDLSDAAMGCAGKGPFFIAEQFAFQQGFGNRHTVYHQERFFYAKAVLINGAGRQFLAGAGFAPDEDSRVRGGHPTDGLIHFLHGAAASDDGLPGAVFRSDVHFDGRAHEPPRFDRFGDDLEHVRNFKRFEDIIKGAHFGRFDGGFGGSEGRHDDDRQLGFEGVDGLEGFKAVDAGKADVQNNEVRDALMDQSQTGLAGGRAFDLIAFFG